MTEALQIAPEIVRDLDNEVGELRRLVIIADGTLDHYVAELCEGWCRSSPPEADFGDDCGGCRARLALAKLRAPSPSFSNGERQ